MADIHHVHMERLDPKAPSSTQVWRAQVKMDTLDSGVILTEEGEVGGSYKQVDLSPERWAGGSPVEHLQTLIADRLNAGWEITLRSEEARSADAPLLNQLFQVAGADEADQVSFLLTLKEALRAEECDCVGWIDPQKFRQLENGTPPVRWEAELQVGRDRIMFKAGNGRKVVISSEVPMGSPAAQLLTILVAGAPPAFRSTMTDASGNAIDAKEQIKGPSSILEGFRELAYALNVAARPLNIASHSVANSDLAPCFF
ncbi:MULTISPECIES: hypothetical protein [Stenotrophomonas]|uniref:hypothetical protein n=1 Tax=Stenotrophomonas TaxID=40323 RepID=UPI0021C73E88|nr:MULTISPECIES: hypothetical protein [Stenotrophomonas]MCU1136966.1 hypothetical protein [Stenotrophomonas maltophilia]MEC4339709.1 hypothetical protein [Stenotrophomonas pavanii]